MFRSTKHNDALPLKFMRNLRFPEMRLGKWDLKLCRSEELRADMFIQNSPKWLITEEAPPERVRLCLPAGWKHDFLKRVPKLNTSLYDKWAEEMSPNLSFGLHNSFIFFFLHFILLPLSCFMCLVAPTLLSKCLKIYTSAWYLRRNRGVRPKRPFRRSLILRPGRKWSAARLKWLTRGY